MRAGTRIEFSALRGRVAAALQINFVLRSVAAFGPLEKHLFAEIEAHYRVPHVRCIVRTRVMCQARRARAADVCDAVVAWLCVRAPLWVVVRVCALLHER